MQAVWIEGELRVAYDTSATLETKGEVLEIPACPFTEYFSYFLAPNTKGEHKLHGLARVQGVRDGNRIVSLEQIVFVADLLKIHMRVDRSHDLQSDD